MILTDEGIKEAVKRGDIKIDPWNEKQLNPNSYNIRLGGKFLIYNKDRPYSIYHNPKPDEEFELRENDKKIFYPGELILAETMEYTQTKNLVPMLEGRSSMGRQFCFIHVSAGFGDNGFSGKWTLEIVPMAPVVLWHGMEIGQIFYHTIEGKVGRTYQGRYNLNDGVQTVINGGE